jgi:hypothetical protein
MHALPYSSVVAMPGHQSFSIILQYSRDREVGGKVDREESHNVLVLTGFRKSNDVGVKE